MKCEEQMTVAIKTSMRWWLSMHWMKEKRDQVRWVISREHKKSLVKRRAGLLLLFWTFPHCLLPFIHPLCSPYPYDIPLQVQSSPLFSFSCRFSASLCLPLWASVFWWYQCSRTPPLTDNKPWMVPCSVQSSALQFCHGEHKICGGWMGSPPSPPPPFSHEWYRPDGGR